MKKLLSTFIGLITILGICNSQNYNPIDSAKIYKESKDFERAVQFYKEGNRSNPRFWNVYNEAELLFMLGKKEEGEFAVEKGLRLARQAGNAAYKEKFENLLNDSQSLVSSFNQKRQESTKGAIKKAQNSDILLRHTMKKGIIGEDYIPAVYGRYNAGPKISVNGQDIQFDDYQSYVKSGGYSKEVSGYTAVFQMINDANVNYIVPIRVKCTGLFNDTRKQSWLSQLVNLSYNDYVKVTEKNPIEYKRTYILKSGESIKDQVIVGEIIPDDFELIIDGEIAPVSDNWISGLNNSFSSSNIEQIDKYIDDPLAKAWKNELKEHKKSIVKFNEDKYSENYMRYITSNIKVLDERLFDIDFDSDVELTIENKGPDKVMIEFSSPLGDDLKIIEPYSKHTSKKVSKGTSRNDLKVTINYVTKM